MNPQEFESFLGRECERLKSEIYLALSGRYARRTNQQPTDDETCRRSQLEDAVNLMAHVYTLLLAGDGISISSGDIMRIMKYTLDMFLYPLEDERHRNALRAMRHYIYMTVIESIQNEADKQQAKQIADMNKGLAKVEQKS